MESQTTKICRQRHGSPQTVELDGAYVPRAKAVRWMLSELRRSPVALMPWMSGV